MKLMTEGVPKNGKKFSVITVIRYCECLLLSIICYIFYPLSYIHKYKIASIWSAPVIGLILPFLRVIWEVFVMIRTNAVDNERNAWVERWDALKKRMSSRKSSKDDLTKGNL